jgi:hypothetical protein
MANVIYAWFDHSDQRMDRGAPLCGLFPLFEKIYGRNSLGQEGGARRKAGKRLHKHLIELG